MISLTPNIDLSCRVFCPLEFLVWTSYRSRRGETSAARQPQLLKKNSCIIVTVCSPIFQVAQFLAGRGW